MDQTTQQNSALVEQMAAAAESLEDQARDLMRAASRFRLAPPAGLAMGGGEAQAA
jgi:methyl-accepting chemotaxis protein